MTGGDPAGPSIVPPRLRPGGVIAVISPSSGDAGRLPRRADRALGALARLGFTVEVMPHALRDRSWVSGTVHERVSDIHRAFADPRVLAIGTFIGGNHSAQLLHALDWDLLAGNPKIVFGYSDVTSLLHAIHRRTGLVTFYGPAVLVQFGEWPGPLPETVAHFLAVTSDAAPVGVLPALETIVCEAGDWADDEVRARPRERATGRRVLRDGSARGRLVAGCLPTLRHLVGTPWQLENAGRILVLDIPDRGYRLSDVDADLWHLRNAGALDDLAGLVVGRPSSIDPRSIDELCGVVARVVRPYTFPVMAQFECGHGDPALTIPLGLTAELAGTELTVTEPAVC